MPSNNANRRKLFLRSSLFRDCLTKTLKNMNTITDQEAIICLEALETAKKLFKTFQELSKEDLSPEEWDKCFRNLIRLDNYIFILNNKISAWAERFQLEAIKL
jgi:hypothetical protein